MTHISAHQSNRKALAVLLLILTISSSRVSVARADTLMSLPAINISSTPFLLTQTAAPSIQTLPQASYKTYHYVVDATAYTSSPEETKPDDPFTTADGTHTHDGVLAANFLPFNSKVRIPELFGDKIFTVHDRMNARFNDRARYLPRVDVWMEKKPDMRQFGIHRKITIEVIEMGNGKKHWGEKLAVVNQENKKTINQ